MFMLDHARVCTAVSYALIIVIICCRQRPVSESISEFAEAFNRVRIASNFTHTLDIPNKPQVPEAWSTHARIEYFVSAFVGWSAHEVTHVCNLGTKSIRALSADKTQADDHPQQMTTHSSSEIGAYETTALSHSSRNQCV